VPGLDVPAHPKPPPAGWAFGATLRAADLYGPLTDVPGVRRIENISLGYVPLNIESDRTGGDIVVLRKSQPSAQSAQQPLAVSAAQMGEVSEVRPVPDVTAVEVPRDALLCPLTHRVEVRIA